jgi:uncharacterized protein (TIGR02996 family)
MSQSEAFLQAIIEAPNDDVPRLVFADWLDDHGDADRAEFIRLQIELARLDKNDPRRPALQQREVALLEQHAWEWAEPLGPYASEWVFRRGFVEKVQARLERPADEIREMLRLAPIRHLRHTGQFCDFDGVLGVLPDFARLTGLEFWGLYAFDDETFRHILLSPHLANLRTLILHHDRNGNLAEDDVLIEALGSPYRSNLRHLEVNVDSMWRGPSQQVMQAMADSPYLSQVRKLNLTETRLNLPLFHGLLKAMPRLCRIDLHECEAPIEVWDALLQRAQQGRLKWLRLSEARILEQNEERGRDLEERRKYRRGFKAAGVKVDWVSDFVDPWNGGVWSGHTWEDLRRRHLQGMNPYLQARDYAGLEAAYREECRKFAGEEPVAMIDALPFGKFESDLAPGLREAAAAIGEAKALYLEVEAYQTLKGRYRLTGEDPGDRLEPYETYFGLRNPLGEFSGAEMAGVETLVRWQAQTALDPGAVAHYLMARTLAAFGRCLRRQPVVPIPVLLRWSRVVFRM